MPAPREVTKPAHPVINSGGSSFLLWPSHAHLFKELWLGLLGEEKFFPLLPVTPPMCPWQQALILQVRRTEDRGTLSPPQRLSLSATYSPGSLKELREPGRKHKLPGLKEGLRHHLPLPPPFISIVTIFHVQLS